jgi:MFS family permease
VVREGWRGRPGVNTDSENSKRTTAANRALLAAGLGYMLDAMDVLLYVFALQTLRGAFGLSNAQAGLISSATLATSAIGGIVAGVLSDRFGRRRLLVWTILLYSLGSLATATSHTLLELMLWRALVGLGLGGQWAAGATLVAETWPARTRAKAMGFMQGGWAAGYMLAAVVSGLILPRFGWRPLFVIGVLPALLTVWVRSKVEESPVWLRTKRSRSSLLDLFRPPLLRKTALATAIATVTLLGYWGLFSWLPGFLGAPKSAGGAGLTIVNTSAWVFIMQAGALAGYVSFGFLADRFGRRPVFCFYVLIAAVLTPIYGLLPKWGLGYLLPWLGPLVGFFGSGYFSLFGAMLAELYPTAVRGAGQGFTYNFGRLLCAAAPYAVGLLADSQGIGRALALNSAFFAMAGLLIWSLPETRQTDLETV